MSKQKPPRQSTSRERVKTAVQGGAEIDSQALEEARRDPQVEAFLRDVKERGERLHRKGLIHP